MSLITPECVCPFIAEFANITKVVHAFQMHSIVLLKDRILLSGMFLMCEATTIRCRIKLSLS